MARVKIYSMEWCPYCAKVKALFAGKDIEYEERDVTHDEDRGHGDDRATGQRGVPQIFIDGEWVGGYDASRT